MKNVYTIKTNRTPWINSIIAAILGFCLASCADNSLPVPEAEYSAKIVGQWQGTVGHFKETMLLKGDGTFLCKLYPAGFIANTLSQGVTGTIRGTWKITGAIITLRITSSENEHLRDKVVSSTIVSFRTNKLVLRSDRGETSPFQRVADN